MDKQFRQLRIGILVSLAAAFLSQGTLPADTIRIHRTDKLGESSESSPRFDHSEARAEAKIVFQELAEKQGWDFTQSSNSRIFTDEGLKDIDVILTEAGTLPSVRSIYFEGGEPFLYYPVMAAGIRKYLTLDQPEKHAGAKRP